MVEIYGNMFKTYSNSKALKFSNKLLFLILYYLYYTFK